MKTPPLIPTLLVAFFVILMTTLGFWQINRAEEKTQLLSLLSDDNVTVIERKSQIRDLPRYGHVVLTGRFLPDVQLLLDNQFNEKSIGYHVFSPFKLEQLNLIIMVNRGWLAKKDFEDAEIELDESITTIYGRLNEVPKVGVQLGEISLVQDKAHQIITYYDEEKINKHLYERLCQRLDCVISDRVVLLSADQEGQIDQGFARNWKPIIMLPSKHIAYAVQWFSMTLVLIAIFIYWLRKTGSENL